MSYRARAMRIAIDIVALLVTVVGGRIVPAYTATILRAAGAVGNHVIFDRDPT